MVLGVPVVTTDAGAAGEVVTDGVTGVLLPSSVTPETLADALVRLARDDARRAALASNARARVQARFSPDAYRAAVAALLPV